MTDLITRFDVAIHERLDSLQHRLDTVKDRLRPEGSAVDKSLDAVEARVAKTRGQFAEASQIVDDWADFKLDVLMEWRENKAVDKLLRQSERSQRHAEAALDVAMGALDAAELAITQASIAEGSVAELAPDADDQSGAT